MRFSAAAVALLALAASAAQAAPVVVFGDSWGSFSARSFEQMFASRGYDIEVDNTAIGGTTAKYWARNPNSLLDRLEDNPDVQWIWLSIGGNDGINELLDGTPIAEIIADAIENTKIFLNPVLAAYPRVKIVQFGYDIVNFEFTRSCESLGNELFPDCGTDTTCKNQQMILLQFDYVDGLSAQYNTSAPGFHTAVNLLGSLQAADSSIPAPYPNLAFFSPEDLMSDCIHPTDAGFTTVFDVFWDKYWASQVSFLGPRNPELAAKTQRKMALQKQFQALISEL